jgi:hypothetical protein
VSNDIVSLKYRAIAIELRAAPAHWTQGWFARTPEGLQTWGGDPNASCWCALGIATRDEVPHTYLYQALGSMDDQFALSEWNDQPGRTAAEVADLFDLAAELASQTAGAAS